MPFAFAGCGAGAGFAVNPFGRVPCGFVCAGAGAGFGFGADSALKPFWHSAFRFCWCRCWFCLHFWWWSGGPGW